MSDVRELRESIVAGVWRFGAFRKRWTLFEGAARFVVGCLGALLGWFLLDWAIKLPMWPLVHSANSFPKWTWAATIRSRASCARCSSR